ncbi:type VI secretion system baseplate subunit TssG [Pseudomonas sp. 7P_10.2_Bac1]|uniref:type VI secretion system baseplate subunit TssG n=1 Tax=Pseudomonas sp. 7P_10.2_Bac1 TaxID=2971614 RepID=UPI0021CA5701|nr:type VI secretion system baseplate subunit TssG [Pseudomonas sp. 7P_10.2_Bac1]MCU1726896.1 type VI secretion system baseplate subunit TssG [Pseudomonas sp. 7P_10.2_Bac1]
MASADRQTTRDLTDTLLADARNYSFYRLLEHLHALHGDDLEVDAPSAAKHRRVRLQSHPRLGFPASDVTMAERLDEDHYRVQTTFLGLHGSDSPLPGYYLDLIAYEDAQGRGIRPAFLDFFNHRLLTLLHDSWRRYRYYIRFQPEARDGFSRCVFAMIGLSDSELRGHTALPWSRLLSFAGLLASRSRSPTIVAGIVGHCFDLQGVYIREFEARYVLLQPVEQLALGRPDKGVLGDNFVIGGRVKTRRSKFTLVIPDLDETRFRQFLPSGQEFQALRTLMNVLMRDVIAYDLELGLRQEDVPPFNLGRQHGTHLGWTSFLDKQDHRQTAVVRIKGRS